MKSLFQLTTIAALMGVSGISQAALTTSTGPVAFSGTASVTATANSTLSTSANNNNASAASVSLGQFNAATGVLTGVDVAISSNRTQSIQGVGSKNNGPGRTASGSGTSTAALTAPGISNSFAPAITQAGTGCDLAMGPTGAISCTWGPNTAASTATDGSNSANTANLDDYVGAGTVSASLSLPSLSATSTLSRTQGQSSSSSTTYSVDWAGDVSATYSYLLHADASFNSSSALNSLTLDFGTVAQGSSASPLAFSLSNLANADRVGLDLDSISGTGNTVQLSTDLATFAALSQGNSNLFNALLDTSTAGLFSAQYILNLSDADIGASSTRNSYQLTLNLTGNVAPVPVPGAVWLFGSAMLGFLGIKRRKALA